MTVSRQHLARRVADAARSVPGVARLSTSGAVRISTPFAGGRVDGVRVEDDQVTIGIVINTMPVQPIVDSIRSTVAGAVDEASHAVRVIVADIDVDCFPEATE